MQIPREPTKKALRTTKNVLNSIDLCVNEQFF